MAFAGMAYVRSYTTAPQAQPARTLESLKKVHEGIATTTTAKTTPNILASGFAAPAASVLSDRPKREPERETRRSFHTGGLLEAKRRAQQHITDMTNDPKQQ